MPSKSQILKQQTIFGIDEVGRGALAGPVVAVAITGPQFPISNFQFPTNFQFFNFQIKDSKQLSPKKREAIFGYLKSNCQVVWAFGRVGEGVIDKINIFEATKLAMKRAVLNLEKKIGKKADLLLLDGNFKIHLKRNQQPIIKGDEKEPLIAFASIIAKVSRDNFMEKQHQKHPEYGFNKHKGYGTGEHFKAILTNGPCCLHRRSFRLL